MIKRTSFVLLLSVILHSSVQAHEGETWLMALAQRAEELQTCLVHQTSGKECDSEQARLNAKSGQCRAELHPGEAIDRAVAYGKSLVKGNPAQSPYQRQVTRERWENSKMQPNVVRFEKLFADYGSLQAALTERFGTEKCPKDYEGSPDRWIYKGPVNLVRYSLSETGPEAPEHRVLHLFAREKAGACYAPESKEEDSAYRVVNIPDLLLVSLAGKGELIECGSDDCVAEEKKVKQDFDKYQRIYRRYRQLVVCSDVEQRNANRGSVKGIRRSMIKAPDYCPAENAAQSLSEARNQAEQLDRMLFQPGKRLSTVTKTE